MMAAEKRPPIRAGVNGPKQQARYKTSYYSNYSHAQNKILPEDIAGIDLPSIVEASGVNLAKRGDRYSGLCPFHQERTPSFFIFRNVDRDRFKCFGCGESGDALDFVQRAYGLDFKGALNQLGLAPFKMTPKLSRTIRNNKHGDELVSSFQKWVDRQLDIACIVIHTCNRMVQRIKNPNGFDAYGVFYHTLAVAEYRHQWLCEASDAELYRLFIEGGFYA